MRLFGKLLLVLVTVLVMVFATCGITWIWLSYEDIPNLISPSPGLSFDYIIVGAGTCGSVLAHELSRNSNHSILLIEAGHLFNPLSKIPLLATVLQHSKNDWQFKSVPQKYSSSGLTNQMQSHPRGKGLGGSSQINYMLHFSGAHKDFETWSKMGIKGWSIRSQRKSEVEPQSCSRLACKNLLECETGDRYSNENGFCYQSIYDKKNHTGKQDTIWTVPKNYSKLSEAFTEAAPIFESEGLKFKLARYNIKEGLRYSTYETFLRPSFGRTNLKILSNTLARKIIIRDGIAEGVLIESSEQTNKYFQITATKEVILSAGAFQTPQLLHVSGVGPKKVLDRIGVKQVYNSVNVGSNLHDHFHLPLFVSIDAKASLTVRKILSLGEIVKYVKTREGHFSNFAVIGDIKTDNDATASTIFATGAVDEKALMKISNFNREDFRALFPLYHNSSQEGFVLLSSCLQPQSRGVVRARSSDIEVPPLIDPRYAQNQSDVECIIKSVRNGVKVIMSEPFQSLKAKIHWPKIKNCSAYGPLNRDFFINEPSDKYLECLIRTVGLTGHHPGGTCSMGSRLDSVVDNRLRFRGINKLRVVDASILPTPVSGTPNSVLVAIAKRAAMLILRQNQLAV
ncbi:neither inactivation nor afterpotential protein G isoform X2 [Hermetia illucens]|uniref:neither inactivation nor afterpotential protein G isoform X2 n=1 Tax=Hermetia illucens TaxID=343691 RepID=UPI0018CC1D9B|nr:neither inactivation nor afterpotential protein G isoform X2 [Hermetia illucens]